MKFVGDSSHLFGGLYFPCDGTLRTVFREMPCDLTAEFWEVPINGRAGMAQTSYHLVH